jgi:hypothetical protein
MCSPYMCLWKVSAVLSSSFAISNLINYGDRKKIFYLKLWTRVNKGYEYFIFNYDIIYKNILFFARRENKQNPLFRKKFKKKSLIESSVQRCHSGYSFPKTEYSLKIECRIGRILIVQFAISTSIFCGDGVENTAFDLKIKIFPGCSIVHRKWTWRLLE